MLDLVRHYLRADNVAQLVGRIIRYLPKATGHKRGLLQGNPLSPLLMNLYLHHHLDRQWRSMTRFSREVVLAEAHRVADAIELPRSSQKGSGGNKS